MSYRAKNLYLFWFALIVGLILGALIFRNKAHAAEKLKPRVITVKTDREECTQLKHRRACKLQEIIFINPLLKKVEVNLDCGPDDEYSSFKLYPHTKQTIFIRSADNEFSCFIRSWRIIK